MPFSCYYCNSLADVHKVDVRGTGLFYQIFCIIQSFYDICMEILGSDVLGKAIFDHYGHRLFVDVGENQCNLFLFCTVGQFAQ